MKQVRHTFDDQYEPPWELQTGRVEVEPSTSRGEFEGIRAILWLPDPEARRGWREFYVRDAVPKPGGRIGFGKI